MFNGNGRIGSMVAAFILLIVAINVGQVRNEERKPMSEKRIDVAIVVDGYALDREENTKDHARINWHGTLNLGGARSIQPQCQSIVEKMVESAMKEIGGKENVSATFAILFRGNDGIKVQLSFDDTSKLDADAIVNKLRRINNWFSISYEENGRSTSGRPVAEVRAALVDRTGKNREDASDLIVWIALCFYFEYPTIVEDHEATVKTLMEKSTAAPDLALIGKANSDTFRPEEIPDPTYFWMIGNNIAFSKRDWHARDNIVANQLREMIGRCKIEVLNETGCYFTDPAQSCANEKAYRTPGDASDAWSKYCMRGQYMESFPCDKEECQRHCVGGHLEWEEVGECSVPCGPGWQKFKTKNPTMFTRHCTQDKLEMSCNLGECTTTTPTTQPPTTEPSNETSIQIANTTPKSKEEGIEVWMIVLIALGSTAALAVLILIPVCIFVSRKRRIRRAKAKAEPKQRPRVGSAGGHNRGNGRHDKQRGGGRGESTMMGDSRIDDRRRDETARSDLQRGNSMTTDRRDRRPTSRSPPRTTQRSVVSTAGRSYDRNRRR